MIRATFPSDVFIPRKRAVTIQVNMHTRNLKANIDALLDSGATDNFISPTEINRFKIKTYPLSKPKIIHNVDGSKNSIGSITSTCNLEIQHGNLKKTHCFFIIDLGSDCMLLGYPFLAAYNPKINWTEGKVYGRVQIRSKDADQWTQERQRSTYASYNPANEDPDPDEESDHFIPSNERNTVTYHNAYLRKTTKSTQIAIEVTDKAECTWQEQVPKEYYMFGKVFSEEESQRFPESHPWDHAIDLLPDAPQTLDCKVYPLAPGEQNSLDRFINEHLDKGYIRPSKSPYASPFFFIKKKDGKLRPVQDYRALNKWTVRNKYPLPLIKELIVKLSKKKFFTKFDV